MPQDQARVRKTKQAPEEIFKLAQSIHQLHSSIFSAPVAKANSGYLTLDVGQGLNKNAVTISSRCISFMVPDWTLKFKAEQLGLRTSQGKRKRLELFDITISKVSKEAELFRELLLVARKEAEDRQPQGKSEVKHQ